MPDLPLHPALVHLPLGLAFAVPLVALGITVAHLRGRLPRAAFAILAGMQLLLAGSGLVAMRAGHRDERRVERIVGERVIDVHEERGEAFVFTGAGVTVLALALLVVPGRLVGAVSAATVAGAFAVAGLAFLTGKAGGEIVYRHGGASAFASPASEGVRGPPPEAHEDDDD